MAKKQKKTSKRREKKNIAKGVVHIQATFNNTIITVTDVKGNTISWASAGSLNFRGAKKSTPFAAQTTAEAAIEKAKEHGIRSAEIRINGPGVGREAAIRAIDACGVKITRIRDVTPIPHNGCRPPKRRRV